jgi:ATP-dependent DNA ligase
VLLLACHFLDMEWRTNGQPGKRPGTVEPCIPTRALKPPVGPQWIHEIKHDGYRLIARKQGDRVRLFTRRGFDWTDRYPLIRDCCGGAADRVRDDRRRGGLLR